MSNVRYHLRTKGDTTVDCTNWIPYVAPNSPDGEITNRHNGLPENSYVFIF